MSKLVRNAIFTVIVLGLTAVGLSWTRHVTQKNDPVQISETVLSAAQASVEQPFPLSVQFVRSHLNLGQFQTLQLTTVPNAVLRIVTVYPSGQVNNPQTLMATSDETGRYSLRFKLDDFSLLGAFETKVIAQSGGQQAEAIGRFALQAAATPDKAISSDGYLYPLVP